MVTTLFFAPGSGTVDFWVTSGLMGNSLHLDLSNTPGIEDTTMPSRNPQRLGYEIDEASHASWWDENTSRTVATRCHPCIMRCRSRVWLPGFRPSPIWQPVRYVRPWFPNGQLRPHVKIPRGPVMSLQSMRASGVKPTVMSVGEGRFRWLRPVTVTF